MYRSLILPLAFLLASAPALAQDTTSSAEAGRCTTPDSVVVRGNARISESSILADAGITRGEALNFRSVQRAIGGLFDTGQFDDIKILCDPPSASKKSVLAVVVKERPVLDAIDLRGFKTVSKKSATDSVDILIGRALDPTKVAKLVARVDSLYQKEGYYLARVKVDSQMTGDHVKLVVTVDEGRRLAVSGVQIDGNRKMSDKEIVGAMKTRPEGFFWFRKGEFDEDKFAGDLGDRIPGLYAKQGFIDFQVLKDTVIVDRAHGKALVKLSVEEGPQYHVGRFDATGNRRWSSEEIAQFYPFTGEGPTLTQRAKMLLKREKGTPKDVFDRARWDDATQKVRTAYSNEGYIYAQVRPVVERRVGKDSTPTVDLRWEIEESRPAIVNRIEIQGNDYTAESCIRDQLVILPGDVFSQDRLIRSYQNIANLGFFETPLPTPDTHTANDQGDVDVIFRVKEKKTGNVNFGASLGGNALGGFIGLEQPNLFGQCKKGSLQWQFGRYIRDFNLSFSDPGIRGSRISGTVSAYDSRPRYNIIGFGSPRRIGSSLQLGFPVPRSPFSRVFASYGFEVQKNDAIPEDPSLVTSSIYNCKSCLRSTLGLTGTHDTRIDMPFPTAGGMQTVVAQFNGGPLGGTSDFQRYTTELFSFAPLGQLGGGKPGSNPVKFVLGLKLRAGAVFGDPGAFFQYQKFSLGGTQYGEQLRGYDEFSVTPNGVINPTGSYQATVQAFGSAFMTTTAELGMRLNQQIYVDAFFDAGNIWNRPQDLNLRFKRGIGVGASVITPIAPLGIDLGYGLDRVDNLGRVKPAWKFHFKLGQIF